MIGAVIQLTHPINADVSWLLVASEKIMTGERPYIDFLETNPPMSFFVYAPAVWLQQLTGLQAEMAQIGLLFALTGIALWLCAGIMRQSGRQADVGAFLVAASFVLLVLPMMSFAEREHIAVVLALPMLSLMVARADVRSVRSALIIAAGVGAGLAIAIKPQFALGFLLPALGIAAQRRSIAPLLAPENWIAAGLAAFYLAIVMIGYPAYYQAVVPIVVETYRQARVPALDLAGHIPVATVFLLGLAVPLICGPIGRSARAWVPLAAALGFLVAFLEQGKGWPYHLYPSLALVYLTLATSGLPALIGTVRTGNRSTISRVTGLAISLASVMALAGHITFLSYQVTQSLPLAATIDRVAPRPRMLAIAYDLSIGQPLARLVGGTWIGSACSQWITETARIRRDAPGTDATVRARMDALIARDRSMLLEDIRRGQPEVILVDRAWSDYDRMLREEPQFAELMGHFRRYTSVNGIDLLLRNDLPAQVDTAAADLRSQ